MTLIYFIILQNKKEKGKSKKGYLSLKFSSSEDGSDDDDFER